MLILHLTEEDWAPHSRGGQYQRVCSYYICSKLYSRIWSGELDKKNKWKHSERMKGIWKTISICRWHDLLYRWFWRSHKKLIRISKLRKGARYKINIQKPTVLLYSGSGNAVQQWQKTEPSIKMGRWFDSTVFQRRYSMANKYMELN